MMSPLPHNFSDAAFSAAPAYLFLLSKHHGLDYAVINGIQKTSWTRNHTRFELPKPQPFTNPWPNRVSMSESLHGFYIKLDYEPVLKYIARQES